MTLNHVRFGRGTPLLLVHGFASSWRSWSLVLDPLARQHEVIAVDLPGHGGSPPFVGETSIATLADALAAFIDEAGLRGAAAVGSSLGARIVLELARRGGVLDGVVALDPGGFWRNRRERDRFYVSTRLSLRLLRTIEPLLPRLLASPTGRALLLARLSERPAALPTQLALEELRGYARAPSFRTLLHRLAYEEPAAGAPRGTIASPLVIGWGRSDRVCPPSQAELALAAFGDARLHWFEHCGHFPQWDAPEETVRFVLHTLHGHASSIGPRDETMPHLGAAELSSTPRARPC
jgi:pimeloyl-ACP methyl ester carboxylesterase